MNSQMVMRLVFKDWYLHRVAISMMATGVLLGVALVAGGGQTLMMVGLNLIMAMLIALTFYLPLSTVLNERTEKTLAFVMSLPVTPADYTMAKILANAVLYALPLVATGLGAALMFPQDEGSVFLSAGHMHAALLAMLVLFSFVLGFALITESMGWTVALIVVMMMVFGNLATLLVPKIPAAREFLAAIGERGGAYWAALGTEAALIVAILGLTFWVQARKGDYL